MGRPQHLDRQLEATLKCVFCRGATSMRRTGLVGDDLRRLIVDRAPTSDVERLAIEQGMETLRVAGLRRALAGRTSLAEVARILT